MAFAKIDLRIGRILSAVPFPAARKPAYQLTVDFGPPIGTRCTSAQLTFGYPDPAALVGRLAVAVVNFPEKKIAGFKSQILVTGLHAPDGVSVYLAQLDGADVPVEQVIGKRVQLDGAVEDDAPEVRPLITFDDFLKCRIIKGEDGLLALDGRRLFVRGPAGKLHLNCDCRVIPGTSLL